MSSPLYQQLQPKGNNMLNMIQQFRENPMSFLSRKFNIPQNMNNPNDIIQHLLNSGQVTQAQVDNAMRRLNDPQIQKLIK